MACEAAGKLDTTTARVSFNGLCGAMNRLLFFGVCFDPQGGNSLTVENGVSPQDGSLLGIVHQLGFNPALHPFEFTFESRVHCPNKPDPLFDTHASREAHKY